MVKLAPPDSDSGLRLYRGRYPSVTTVLKVIEKSYLDAWKSRVGSGEANRVLHNAQTFGTEIHSIAEKLARGEEVEIPKKYAPYAQAVQDFLDDWVEEVHGTELVLISPARGYAGTLDLYCTIKPERGGGRAIVDLKTSRQLTREHGLQTAGYAILLRDNNHEVHRRLVVRIKKEAGAEGKYHVREYGDHAGDVKAFLAVLEVFKWQYRNQLQKLIVDLDQKGEDNG